MLALSRKKNEALVINNNVEITILEVKGDQVKIGITAPKEVPIYRKEVLFLPRKFHGQRSLAGYNPWGSEESDATEYAHIPNKTMHFLFKTRHFEAQLNIW